METALTVSARNSSASCFSCAAVKPRMSDGTITVSKRGVVLCFVKSLALS